VGLWFGSSGDQPASWETVVGHYSTSFVNRHGLAVADESLDKAGTAPDVTSSGRAHLELAADIEDSGTARRDALSNEVAVMRSIHVSVLRLRIGLCAFVIGGALSGLVVGWSLIGFAAFGLAFGVVVGTLAGSFLRRKAFTMPPWSAASIAAQWAGTERPPAASGAALSASAQRLWAARRAS
jgi:hypothetical protein